MSQKGVNSTTDIIVVAVNMYYYYMDACMHDATQSSIILSTYVRTISSESLCLYCSCDLCM